jgi:predicted MFS family arabinose efflux permease
MNGVIPAFYGTYAYLGDEVRSLHGSAASTAGLLALAYGLGCGAATLLDGVLDRVGPHRLLIPVLLLLVPCYAVIPPAVHNLPALLALCLIWGLVNHAGLGTLVVLLARRGGAARGPVMALYSTTTYLAIALATTSLGFLYQADGLAAVTAVAALGLLLALAPAYRIRRPPQ